MINSILLYILILIMLLSIYLSTLCCQLFSNTHCNFLSDWGTKFHTNIKINSRNSNLYHLIFNFMPRNDDGQIALSEINCDKKPQISYSLYSTMNSILISYQRYLNFVTFQITYYLSLIQIRSESCWCDMDANLLLFRGTWNLYF
jgi:hypothetical protein